MNPSTGVYIQSHRVAGLLTCTHESQGQVTFKTSRARFLTRNGSVLSKIAIGVYC